MKDYSSKLIFQINLKISNSSKLIKNYNIQILFDR